MNDATTPDALPRGGKATTTGEKTFRPLRAWPAVLLVALMVAARFGPELSPDAAAKYWMISVFGPLLCCLLLLIWWLAASRATWRERVFGFIGLAASVAAALFLVHPTMRGAATTYLTLPMGFLFFGIAAALLRNAVPVVRTGMLVVLAFAGFSVSMLLRSEGMTGDYKFAFRSRWTQSAEEVMLATHKPEKPSQLAPTDSNSLTNALLHPEWPGFRGLDRASISAAPKIATNWSAHPPEQLWKIQVGPGWSSFTVAGPMLFTQEQRGPKEAVVCYDSNSGKELWKTEIEARLDDPMGGPGPRATPTLANGALYVTGSTGAILRLNPLDGTIVWRKDVTQISGSKVPMWGFSASPLVIGDLVIVYGGGGEEKGLLALDSTAGGLRWSAPCPGDTYSSPQLNRILGEESVLMLTKSGLELLVPTSGKRRLDYEWTIPQYRALQPHLIGEDTILLPTGMNMGTRAVRVKKSGEGYAAEELWTSRSLKPDFVDLVTYKGYAYGNDGGLLTCVDLQTGERKWKGGRYGKGQILLLENSGLLLILAEQGQAVLVPAEPTEHGEIAAFQALEGKTWNHPVLVGDRLYVRNSEQAAAYKVALQ